MKYLAPAFVLVASLFAVSPAQAGLPETGHPDSSTWRELFKPDLSNAVFPKGVWTAEGGVMTASEDQTIWSDRDYENFMLDLEFKTAEGANSGVVVYASDMQDWIPNSLEIQILDDHATKWAEVPKNWLCGAAFGHQAATKAVVKKPGEWNRMTLLCQGPKIVVVLNGERINEIDLSRFTSATKNPDGSDVPAWLTKRSLSSLTTKGRVGLQGKHAGAPIYFRNVRIQELTSPDAGEGWVALFNGKDLEGWEQKNGLAKYSVQDGCIVGQSVPNSPNSFLCTKEDFADFEFEFEVRVDAALNSGVQIRSQSLPTYQNGRVHGYQVEIAVNGFSGGIYDEARRGKFLNEPVKPSAEVQQLVQDNQWAKYRVVCQGDHIQTWVNGIQVTDLHDNMTKTGFIGLQVHGVGDRQDPLFVRWRNLRLRALKS